MKKRFILFVLLFMIIPLKVNATSLSIALSCPASAKAGQTVSCSITGNIANGSLTGLTAKFTYGNGLTFSSFTPSGGWANYYSSASGFNIGNTMGVTGNAKSIGVLKVTIPSNAAVNTSYTVTIGSIDGSDKDNNSVAAPGKTATIKVLSGNNNLTGLSLSNATINFSGGQTSYSATINAATTVVNATLADSSATFVSGYGNRTINLLYGTNSYYVKVKAANGDIKTYTLVITRPDGRSTDNSLKSLTISSGKLNFSPTTYIYDVSVEKEVDSISIDAVANHSKASFVNGFGKRDVKLNYGNNVVLVKVKAENGSEKIYTINVFRTDGRDNNNYLSKLEVFDYNLRFNKDTLEYRFKVLYETEKLDLNISTDSEKAKYDVNGNDLKVGENTVTITVTAENEQIKTYKLIVTRLNEGELLPSANLSELVIENHKIDFDKDKLKYTIELTDEDSLNISVKLENENSLYKIIGNKNLNDKDEVTILVISPELEIKEYVIYIVKNDVDNVPVVSLILVVVLLIIILILYDKLSKKNNNSKQNKMNDNIYMDKEDSSELDINLGVENPNVEPIDMEELDRLNENLRGK